MSLKERFWPHMTDEKQAEITAYYGLYACVVKIAISIFNLQWIEVILFAAIGIGIYKLSRIAAVAGLVIYMTEKIFVLVQGGSLFSGGFYLLIFVYAFINGIRGTFAYQRFAKKQLAPAGPIETNMPEQNT